ncbi:PIN domain-containing protein [Sorangium sp. So ce204]
MRLLLDTHCWIWLVADPERIRRDVVEMLVADGTDVYISAATAWEIVIKHALGKLPLPIPPMPPLPGGPSVKVTPSTVSRSSSR